MLPRCARQPPRRAVRLYPSNGIRRGSSVHLLSMPPPDADALLAAARKRPAPVYLLIGEAFQTEDLARELIELLVPPEPRSLSLEIYDGRSTPIGPILDSVRTPSLLGGTKVIWVREPTLFLSGEKRSDIAAALFDALDDDRAVEAAEKLLLLAALSG